jgi:hypothetical protein
MGNLLSCHGKNSKKQDEQKKEKMKLINFMILYNYFTSGGRLIDASSRSRFNVMILI